MNPQESKMRVARACLIVLATGFLASPGCHNEVADDPKDVGPEQRNEIAMTPKEEMALLLNDAIEMASRLLQEYGTHIPFAMVIDAQKERINIAVDDTTRPPVDQILKDLLREVHRGCADKSYRAVAFAKNVDYKSAIDGSKVDAIQVTIDHIEAEAVTCYLPYTLGNDNAFQPGDLFATEPQLVFFD